MLSIKEQIESGRMVCPVSHEPLIIRDNFLETQDGSHRYVFENGIPILFPDAKKQVEYLGENKGKMKHEYETSQRNGLTSIIKRMTSKDYRSQGYRTAFCDVIGSQPPNALCLSVGGGPNREHPNLVNLNIAPFPNVDVVADAYRLPYADNSVDALYCEAVLEHLEFPDKAVAEMWRVLKKNAPVFAATPFLQNYHGYPNHFQNFTLTGHERLFSRSGFEICSSGTSVGPTVALSMLVASYLFSYFPTRILSRIAGGTWMLLSMLLRPLDYWINKNPGSHILASATYIHAIKPAE